MLGKAARQGKTDALARTSDQREPALKAEQGVCHGSSFV